MRIREANIDDIKQIQVVRNAVKENTLSDPNLVTDEDCRIFITERGKGWVCEKERRIIGFSIADLKDENIWALFLLPEYEGRGIGRELHRLMLDWYFSHEKQQVWLSTSPGTRAEKFYRKAGWRAAGIYGKGEIKFELTRDEWMSMKQRSLYSRGD